MKDYLIASERDSNAESAIIVLPDIWGQTDYSYLTLKQFTEKFKRPCYLLDYFYQITKTPSKFNPETDEGKAVELMNTMRGEDFMDIFKVALDDIKATQPKLTNLTVIGFCFGGRLAYLAGSLQVVNLVVSFYGAGAHSENYLGNSTPIETICSSRAGDKSLKVLSFYGTSDASIPAEDRTKTKEMFAKSNIDYIAKEYEAGHAYFQPGRPNYNKAAVKSSWQELEELIK